MACPEASRPPRTARPAAKAPTRPPRRKPPARADPRCGQRPGRRSTATAPRGHPHAAPFHPREIAMTQLRAFAPILLVALATAATAARASEPAATPTAA